MLNKMIKSKADLSVVMKKLNVSPKYSLKFHNNACLKIDVANECSELMLYCEPNEAIHLDLIDFCTRHKKLQRKQMFFLSY